MSNGPPLPSNSGGRTSGSAAAIAQKCTHRVTFDTSIDGGTSPPISSFVKALIFVDNVNRNHQLNAVNHSPLANNRGPTEEAGQLGSLLNNSPNEKENNNIHNTNSDPAQSV